MLSFFWGGIGKWFAFGGVGILVVAGAYGLGYARGDAACAANVNYAQALADKNAVERELENFKSIIAAQQRLADEHQQRVKDDAVKMEALKEYITALPDSECELPADFLHHLDSFR